jgi:hypothetical protein
METKNEIEAESQQEWAENHGAFQDENGEWIV